MSSRCAGLGLRVRGGRPRACAARLYDVVPLRGTGPSRASGSTAGSRREAVRCRPAVRDCAFACVDVNSGGSGTAENPPTPPSPAAAHEVVLPGVVIREDGVAGRPVESEPLGRSAALSDQRNVARDARSPSLREPAHRGGVRPRGTPRTRAPGACRLSLQERWAASPGSITLPERTGHDFFGSVPNSTLPCPFRGEIAIFREQEALRVRRDTWCFAGSMVDVSLRVLLFF
jgi:hypothetical protein